jgi:predicted MFS family arabinose efflux permease
VFVDRWDRKRVMLISDLVRAGLIGLLLLLTAVSSPLPVWLRLTVIYAVVALSASFAQFFNPSRFATIGAVVAPEDRSRAFSLSSATTSTAAVLGPPLAAPLLFAAGVQWALAINAVSFLASFAFIWWTDIPRSDDLGVEPHGHTFMSELREGWQFIQNNTVLMTIIVAIFLYMFGVGAINVLEVFFVSENLHVSASWLGTLNGTLGAGSILGALLTPRILRKTGDRSMFSGGILLTAVLVLVLTRSSSLVMAIIVFGLIGIPLAIVNTVLGPILLAETPNRLLGRVSAVLNPVVYLASVSSMAIAGIAASALGQHFSFNLAGIRFQRIDTIFFVCGMLMLVAGLYAVRRLHGATVVVTQERSSDVDPAVHSS